MLVKKQTKTVSDSLLQKSILKIKKVASSLNEKLATLEFYDPQIQEHIIPLAKHTPSLAIKINFLQPTPLISQPVFISPFNPWKKSLLNFVLICLIVAIPLQAFSYYQEYSQEQKAITQVKLETSLQLQEALLFLNKLDKDAALQKFTDSQKSLSQIKDENTSFLTAYQAIEKIILILSDTSFTNLNPSEKTLKWTSLIKEILPRVLIIKNSLKNI